MPENLPRHGDPMSISLVSCIRTGLGDLRRAPLVQLASGPMLLLVLFASLGVFVGPLIVGHQQATLARRSGTRITIANLFGGFAQRRFEPAMIAGIGITFLVVVSLIMLMVPMLFTWPLVFLSALPVARGERDGIQAVVLGLTALRRHPFACAGATLVLLTPLVLVLVGLVAFQPNFFGPLATEVLSGISPLDPGNQRLGALGCYVLLLVLLPVTAGAMLEFAVQADATTAPG